MNLLNCKRTLFEKILYSTSLYDSKYNINLSWNYNSISMLRKSNIKIITSFNLILICTIINFLLQSNCVKSSKIKIGHLSKTNNYNFNVNDNNTVIEHKFNCIINCTNLNNDLLSSKIPEDKIKLNLNTKDIIYHNNNNNNNNKTNENNRKQNINLYNRELFDQLTTTNPCLVHYCSKGRECILENAKQPKCICLRYCSHRRRPICGSNGQIYENHCELHRASCIQGKIITYQRMENCFQLNNNDDDDYNNNNKYNQNDNNNEIKNVIKTNENENDDPDVGIIHELNNFEIFKNNLQNITTVKTPPVVLEYKDHDEVVEIQKIPKIKKKKKKNDIYNFLHKTNKKISTINSQHTHKTKKIKKCLSDSSFTIIDAKQKKNKNDCINNPNNYIQNHIQNHFNHKIDQTTGLYDLNHNNDDKQISSYTENKHKTIVIYRKKIITPPTTSTTTISSSMSDPVQETKYMTDLLKYSDKYKLNSYNTLNHIQNLVEMKHILQQQNTDYRQLKSTSLPTMFNKSICTSQEYEIMKDNLLLYSHARLMSKHNNHSKDFLVSVMFSHYDQNNDAHLEFEELNQITIDENLDELSVSCLLTDMLNFDDNNQDGKLSINEFYQAFSKLYSVSVVSLDKALETNHLSAHVGDNVEIKCDVTGTPIPPLIWRRNGIELSSLSQDEIRVYSDGSLYLRKIQLYHSGNYSCHAQRNKDIVQTHVLSVFTAPQVRVTPRIQSKRPGENSEMFCHVFGDPFPKVEWLKNDEPINLFVPKKYKLIGNGTALRISNIAYSDTGAYMCQASNAGISVRDISSLIVQEDPAPSVINEERKFYVFYEYGIAVYEPSSCRLYQQIQGNDIIPGTQEYVCGSKKTKCSWGRSINVGIRYIYASQPTLNRIIVISTVQMVVIEILLTEKYPVELFYVPRLNQVWVLCWKLETTNVMMHNESSIMKMMMKMSTFLNNTKRNEHINDKILKSIQVICDADKKRKHYIIHPEAIDGQFDLVKDLFLPSNNLEQPHYSYNYGYVTHKNHRGIYKLDLQNLRYTKSVDLTLYNCVPEKVEFSALYGFVIMSCREPVTNKPQGQIVLDYLTDAILSTKSSLIGIPKISPDSRHLVIIQHHSDGVVIIVQKIKVSGVEFLFDVRTTLNISDITFFESQSMHGYDLFASAADKEDILYLNLFTGKVEMITGVGSTMSIDIVEWGNSVRTIKSSGLFGQYLVTPSDSAIFIINGRTRTINCEIGGVIHTVNIIWSQNNPKTFSTSVNDNISKQDAEGLTAKTSTTTIQASTSSSLHKASSYSSLRYNEIVNPIPVLNIHGEDQASILL